MAEVKLQSALLLPSKASARPLVPVHLKGSQKVTGNVHSRGTGASSLAGEEAAAGEKAPSTSLFLLTSIITLLPSTTLPFAASDVAELCRVNASNKAQWTEVSEARKGV